MTTKRKSADTEKKPRISRLERQRLKRERIAAEKAEAQSLHQKIKTVLGGAVPPHIVKGSFQEVQAFKKVVSSITKRLDCVTLPPLQKAWADCCRLWGIEP